MERSLANNSTCLPGSSIHGEFSRQEYWSGLPCYPSGGLPKPGIEARSLALQTDPLPSEPPEKPKNIGVDSLSLLQRIFPTQESNLGLLHCTRTLYQLSYQGSLLSVVLGKQLLWSEGFKNLQRLVLKSCLEPSQCQKIDYLGFTSVQFSYSVVSDSLWPHE